MERFIIATDLDGTLFNSEINISSKNLDTLSSLDSSKFVKIIATGRSFYSAYKSLPKHLPINYLASSSGAAIINWKNCEIIDTYNMSKEEVKPSFNLLKKLKLDFSIQNSAPSNHKFDYYQFNKENRDFEKRLEFYQEYSSKINLNTYKIKTACQLIAITKGNNAIKKYKYIKQSLPNLKVIRTTSPIDGESIWIEIYSQKVSKANGIMMIADKLKIKYENILCIGNDYNDLDMLKWAKHSYVVGNAPDELKKTFKTVSSNDKDGFSEAVHNWLSIKNISIY